MNRPNIIFYFTDQQRWDTIGCYGQKLNITPNLDKLAKEGTIFEYAFTPQPVCGPARAAFQTGKYPTELGCYRNGIALPQNVKTIADYLTENGYETGYVGKWHLASTEGLENEPDIDYRTKAIPLERRGGYKGFWRAADVLEFTSHGYDGYVFDEYMSKCEFKGYRVDCITDFALEFLEKQNNEKPFFLTISHIEPHHQNDRKHYEGPKGSKEKFKDFEVPKDLEGFEGDYMEEYPDYLGCCKSLDDNLGRLIDKLKEKGIYENTIIVYASDHGSHFRTRNRETDLEGYDDYKRACQDSCLRVPLIIAGAGYRGGKKVTDLVSTISLPKTFLAMAGIDVGDKMVGENLKDLVDGKCTNRRNEIFAQISESRVGRVIRTKDYKYAVKAPGKHGALYPDSDVYVEEFFYDLNKDPYEKNNLVKDPAYKNIRKELAERLIYNMKLAGEKEPCIQPAQ